MTKKTKKNWSDIKDVANIDYEKIDFVHNYCLDRLKSSLDTSSNIDNKNLACVGFIVTVLLVLVGFLLSQINFSKSLTEQNWLMIPPIALNIIGFFAAALILVIRNMPIKYFPIGQEPENLFNKKIMNLTLKSIKASEIVALKGRIDSNITKNERKSKSFSIAFYIILSSLSLSLIYFLIIVMRL
jgi:hypothetical protein